MGVACSRNNDPAFATSKIVDAQIQRDKKTMQEEVKMLLLGPGESGKSTLFKQMKILARDGGYTEMELQRYKATVYNNCISQMQILCQRAEDTNSVYDSDRNRDNSRRVLTLSGIGGDLWTPELCDILKALWADSSLQRLFATPEVQAQVNESAVYFFNQLDRFRDPEGYTPTKQDVLRARVRSTGIEEAEFKFEELKFRMLDVGGQRSERRKWIHCLADDHQILTSDGFLYMDELRARLEQDAAFLVAGFDEPSGTMVYERPAAFVYNAPAAQRMVALRAGAVDLLVTPEHEMYVQAVQRIAQPFGKLEAGALVTEEPFATVQMLGCAPAGVERVGSVAVWAGLSDEQLGAALWLYGQWLVGSGSEGESGSETVQRRALLMGVAVAAAQVERALQTRRDVLSPLLWSGGLGRAQWRQLLDGMRHASDDSGAATGAASIAAPTAQLRDDIVRACVHAGYAVHTDADATAAAATGRVLFSEQPFHSLHLARDAVFVDDYVGPTWCVTMPRGFLFARRAPAAGPASAPVLMGNCFDAVTVVLFCASLSEYDQTLREDPTTNRMKESLLLFDEIVNSPWFRKTPIVLFLNKTDLFKDKVAKVPLTVCFANYSGPNTPQEGMDYIRARFEELRQDRGKVLYVHFTCAVNTENVEFVFRVVKETLLKEIIFQFSM